MVNEAKAEDTSIHVSTLSIAPPKPWDDSRDNEGGEENERDVPLVLPFDDGALGQVADVGNTGFATGLYEHPAHVGIPKAFVSVVGVEVGIGVAMVRAVATRPPLD